MNLIDQLKIQEMYASGAFAMPALDLTREGIAAMDKAELVDLLEAHGVTPDKRKGQAALAADLIAVVFIDGL